jgi:membrane protease YdiL (CAAX protease family)
LLDIKTVTEQKRIALIPLLLFCGLLVLRFPLIFGARFNLLPISSDQSLNIFLNGTYLLTAILIWFERERLDDFNIGVGSLIILLATPIVKPIYFKALSPYVSYRFPFSWFEIGVSLCLLIALLFSGTKFRKSGIKNMLLWTAIAIIVGLFFGAGNGYIGSYQSLIQRGSNQVTLPVLGYLFVAQLSNAAIAEEPLFRGFLWGYLRKWNWSDRWICLFQAGIFTLGHLYYIHQYPLSFWVIVPLSGLILGLLVWKSRSIGTSMITHGLLNSVADLVSHYTW